MENSSFQIPILFLIFNRPEMTERVFERIRAVRPRRLYVSADGPRMQKAGEDQQCVKTRRIIEKVDWPCEVKTNFSDANLGCRRAVSSGIDWFFRSVSEGIILEDDCLPEISFFHFCETLLQYYRNDDRVMHIGGANFQDGHVRGPHAYYFSALSHIWGWATWKRAWNKYDVDISNYPRLFEQDLFSAIFPLPAMRKYWKRTMDEVYEKRKDTWDTQWQYTLSVHHGLAIVPRVNLISNIGFNLNATHTVDNFHSLANRPTAPIGTITHPEFMVPDLRADGYTFRKYMSPNKIVKSWQLIRRKVL
jgi:hypothetical protein